MESTLFNSFLCNASIADIKVIKQVKRQSIVQRSLSEDNKNNPSDF